MKTTLHVYRFDVSEPAQKAEYEALKAKLKGYPHRMHSSSGRGDKTHYDFVRDLDGQEIELETTHLFENQWNTAPIAGVSDKGLRVFDWASDALFDGRGQTVKHIKQGHYLDQTDDMREVRRNTMKCAYCGKQEPAAKGYVFCPHCIDSEYLTEEHLPLTRMRPVDVRDQSIPLTEAEKAHLLPLFREAQLHGVTERGKARIAKARADVIAKHAKAIANATTERDGFIWLMDHGVRTDNVIFYDHTGQFGFGWRTPCDAAFVSALLDIISEFSWPYEIKCADGRKLNGNIG